MGGSLAVGSSSRAGGSPPGAQQQGGWCGAVAVMSPWPSDPGPRLCNPSRALNTAFLDELRAESNPSNCEELLSPLLWPSLLLDGGATCQLLRLLCWNHEMTSLYVLRSILSGVFELARHGAGTDVVVPGQHSDEGNGPGSQGGRHVGHQPTAHPAGHSPPQQAIHSRDGPGPGADGRPPSMCLDDELCQGPGQAHEDAHEDAQEVGSSGQVQGQQGERGDEEGQGEEPGQSMSSQGSGQAPVEDSLGGPCVQGGQGYKLAEEHSGSQGMQDADIEVGDVEGGGSEREGGGHSNLPRFVAGRHRGQRPLVHVRQHHGSMDGVEVLNSEGGAESVGEEEVDEVLLDED
ncbi:hypothetical protein V8C86DRAFT_2906772 [Haematococcus lacustris]